MPLSNSPSSLEAPTNRPETAPTRPRMASGVLSWTRVLRMKTLSMSAPPRMARAADRHPQRLRDAEHDRRRAEHADTGEHHPSRAPGDRPPRDDRGRSGSRQWPAPTRRMPNPCASDMKHVLGEGGQQRGRAAQDHRREIERDGAEDDLRLSQTIGEALFAPVPCRDPGLRRRPGSDPLIRDEADDRRRGRHPAPPHRPRPGAIAISSPATAGPAIDADCQARELKAMARGSR